MLTNVWFRLYERKNACTILVPTVLFDIVEVFTSILIPASKQMTNGFYNIIASLLDILFAHEIQTMHDI